MKQVTGWPGAVVFITLMAAFLTATAAGNMYRWVDADGNVYYSDQPPPADARDAKNLNERLPISEPDAESESESDAYAEKEAEFQERQKQNAEAEAEAAREAETAALSKQSCDQARADVELVNNPPGGRLRERNAEGVLVYMTEEQLAQRRAEANDAVSKWCES
jgi:hypothetical protein